MKNALTLEQAQSYIDKRIPASQTKTREKYARKLQKASEKPQFDCPERWLIREFGG